MPEVAVDRTRDLDAVLRELAATLDAAYESALRLTQTQERQRLLDADRVEREERLQRLEVDRQRLDRERLADARTAASDIATTGNVLASLIQGRLLPALQGAAGMLQAIAERKARQPGPRPDRKASKPAAPREPRRDEEPTRRTGPAGVPDGEGNLVQRVQQNWVGGFDEVSRVTLEDDVVSVDLDDATVNVRVTNFGDTPGSPPEPPRIPAPPAGTGQPRPDAVRPADRPAPPPPGKPPEIKLPEPPAMKEVRKPDAPPAAGGEGTGALAGAAGALTTTVAVVAAFVVAIGAAVAALTAMSRAATPQAWSTLNDAMGVVSATIGSVVTPYLFRFGQAATFVGDMLFELVPKFVAAFEDSAASFGKTVRLTLEALIPVLKPLDAAVAALTRAFVWSAERLVTAAAYVLSYVSKKGGDAAGRLRDDLRGRLTRAKGKTPLDGLVAKLDSVVAKFADTTKVGGKSLTERWNEAGKEFANATVQKLGSGARYEQAADSYKRIQQAAVGQTTYEQKMLQIAFDNAQAMLRVAGNTDKLAAREGPLR